MFQLPGKALGDTQKLTVSYNLTNGVPQRSPDSARTLTFTGPKAHHTLPRDSRESAPRLTARAIFPWKCYGFRALNLELEEL